jgi:hypothetical protein
MKTVITTGAPDTGREIIEAVITKGNLAQLTPQERTRFYVEVCKSVGLNALTKPFEFIELNGKLTLYALRSCTEQLRTIHGVSVDEMSESERDGVFIVTTKVRNKHGRTDVAKGAVSIANLKGDALANAMMKAETKSKRRATLSLCGLGFLDESEVETIPAPAVRTTVVTKDVSPPSAPPTGPAKTGIEPPHHPKTGETSPHVIAVPKADTQWRRYVQWGSAYIAAIGTSRTAGEIDKWQKLNDATLADIKTNAAKIHTRIEANIAAARKRLASSG